MAMKMLRKQRQERNEPQQRQQQQQHRCRRNASNSQRIKPFELHTSHISTTTSLTIFKVVDRDCVTFLNRVKKKLEFIYIYKSICVPNAWFFWPRFATFSSSSVTPTLLSIICDIQCVGCQRSAAVASTQTAIIHKRISLLFLPSSSSRLQRCKLSRLFTVIKPNEIKP